ncbi:MAG: hypothetical protein ABIJ57_17255 [Pseudomonadota bacterium]
MNESLFTNAMRPRPDALFKPGTQNERLYRRLLEGPVANIEIVREMNILNSTGRISEVRAALREYLMDVKAERAQFGNGVFIYSLVG